MLRFFLCFLFLFPTSAKADSLDDFYTKMAKTHSSDIIETHVKNISALYRIQQEFLAKVSNTEEERYYACKLSEDADSVVDSLKSTLERGYINAEGQKYIFNEKERSWLETSHLERWEARLKKHERWCR